jgi:predicted dithiol-disulfide oxidoreductase (DUF899 family)
VVRQGTLDEGNVDVNTDTTTPAPAIVDQATYHAQVDALRVREKAHTRQGDAIAAARRRLPMMEVDATLALTGEKRAGDTP